jgi:hypothetical protein
MAKKSKPMRYPRKLRQTIEKVASARDERAATGDPNAGLEGSLEANPLFHNFWKDFLPRNSVYAMMNTVDEVLRRIEVVYHMAKPVAAPRVLLRPPWQRESGA